MGLILPIVAVTAGVALGLWKGGSLTNAVLWRPVAWQLAVGGAAVELLLRLTGWSGGFAVLLDLLGMIAITAVAVLNIRVGGMVLIVVGMSLNILPALLNWGTPVSGDALVSAGVVTRSELRTSTPSGPRHLADRDLLEVLGETIPLPTGQVISIGDVVLLAGYVLTIASVLRRRRVRDPATTDYRRRISPLGRGPAPPDGVVRSRRRREPRRTPERRGSTRGAVSRRRPSAR